HPKTDPTTGELHAIGYFWGRPELLEYTVWGTDGRIRRRVDVPVGGNPMVHDCALTERFVVLYDLPVTFDLASAAEGRPFPYVWDPDHRARIGLLPRAGGEPIWFEVEPCYVFHSMNAHDDGDRVVIDAVRHPRAFDTDRNGPNEGAPVLWRWTLDPSDGSVTEQQLDDRPIEFPRVDERLTGASSRYGWAGALSLSGE